MKALAFVVIVILVGAVLLGLNLSQTDVFNPHTRIAEASRIEAETAALVAQNEYDEQLRQIELDRIREETKINLEALRARRAKEVEILEQEARRRSDLHELAVLLVVGAGAVAILVLSVALAYYLVCRGNAARAGQPSPSAQPSRRPLAFPSARPA
jgi:hypothetical protein